MQLRQTGTFIGDIAASFLDNSLRRYDLQDYKATMCLAVTVIRLSYTLNPYLATVIASFDSQDLSATASRRNLVISAASEPLKANGDPLWQYKRRNSSIEKHP